MLWMLGVVAVIVDIISRFTDPSRSVTEVALTTTTVRTTPTPTPATGRVGLDNKELMIIHYVQKSKDDLPMTGENDLIGANEEAEAGNEPTDAHRQAGRGLAKGRSLLGHKKPKMYHQDLDPLNSHLREYSDSKEPNERSHRLHRPSSHRSSESQESNEAPNRHRKRPSNGTSEAKESNETTNRPSVPISLPTTGQKANEASKQLHEPPSMPSKIEETNEPSDRKHKPPSHVSSEAQKQNEASNRLHASLEKQGSNKASSHRRKPLPGFQPDQRPYEASDRLHVPLPVYPKRNLTEDDYEIERIQQGIETDTHSSEIEIIIPEGYLTRAREKSLGQVSEESDEVLKKLRKRPIHPHHFTASASSGNSNEIATKKTQEFYDQDEESEIDRRGSQPDTDKTIHSFAQEGDQSVRVPISHTLQDNSHIDHFEAVDSVHHDHDHKFPPVIEDEEYVYNEELLIVTERGPPKEALDDELLFVIPKSESKLVVSKKPDPFIDPMYIPENNLDKDEEFDDGDDEYDK